MTLFTLIVATVVLGAEPGEETQEAAQWAQWLPVFERVAEECELTPEAAAAPLKLLERPVYKWARSGPEGGTNGAIFVWTREGCAEVVACFWRSPAGGGKSQIAHELHSLSPSVLHSGRTAPKEWKPQA